MGHINFSDVRDRIMVAVYDPFGYYDGCLIGFCLGEFILGSIYHDGERLRIEEGCDILMLGWN